MSDKNRELVKFERPEGLPVLGADEILKGYEFVDGGLSMEGAKKALMGVEATSPQAAAVLRHSAESGGLNLLTSPLGNKSSWQIFWFNGHTVHYPYAKDKCNLEKIEELDGALPFKMTPSQVAFFLNHAMGMASIENLLKYDDRIESITPERIYNQAITMDDFKILCEGVVRTLSKFSPVVGDIESQGPVDYEKVAKLAIDALYKDVTESAWFFMKGRKLCILLHLKMRSLTILS